MFLILQTVLHQPIIIVANSIFIASCNVLLKKLLHFDSVELISPLSEHNRSLIGIKFFQTIPTEEASIRDYLVFQILSKVSFLFFKVELHKPFKLYTASNRIHFLVFYQPSSSLLPNLKKKTACHFYFSTQDK